MKIQPSQSATRTCRTARHRGSVYLAVLGASMVVSVLGVAGLYAVRLQGKISKNSNEAIRAAAVASSAVEYGRYMISIDSGWRTRHSHDRWVSDVAFDGGTFTYKLVDTADTDLSNNATHTVRLYGKSTLGKATRIQSVELAPSVAGKMLPVAGSWRQEVLP